MDFGRFVVMTTMGCFAWSVILVYAGFLAGSVSTSTFATSSTVIDGLSGLVAAMSAAYIVYYAYSARKSPGPGTTPPASVS
jgi:membrane protein DedA with SNARE-associated domain